MFSNGEVVEGHNYGSISTMATKLSFSGEKIYGFVTSYGEFVLPYEAAIIALKAGQIPSIKDELKPEDLWPEWAEE
jgi:hypothetical protein